MDRIIPSATMRMTQTAADLKARGIDVISFTAGEPDFPTPRYIIDAACSALRDGATRYTAISGTMELRRAVAAQSESVRRVPCQPEEVIICAGAKHVLYNLFMAILDEGDEVIVPLPAWVSYPDQVRLAGGVPVGIPTTEADGWLLSPEALEKAITPRTKALVLNSPCNPTGAVYDEDALRALVNLAVHRNLLVVSDEIYRDLLYDDVAFAPALTAVNADGRNRIFTVDGVSKSYAMTGWRIGWGIGDPDIIRGMTVMQGQTISCPTAVSQSAAREALSRDADFLPAWRSEYADRRDAMVRGLNAMAGVTCRCPRGAFYVFPDVTGLASRLGAGKTDEDVARWLLDEARVATVPGSAFGAPGYLRLSYAVAMSLVNDGISRMTAAISAL